MSVVAFAGVAGLRREPFGGGVLKERFCLFLEGLFGTDAFLLADLCVCVFLCVCVRVMFGSFPICREFSPLSGTNQWRAKGLRRLG